MNIPKPCESTPRLSVIDTESWFLTEKKIFYDLNFQKATLFAQGPYVPWWTCHPDVESRTELQSTLGAGPFGHFVTMAHWDSLA